jgi:hypothetical protein
MYLEPSCPNHPFPEELGDTEINTRIFGVLAHGVVLNLGVNPIPLWEGVNSPWVCLLGHALGCLCHNHFSTYTCSCTWSRVCSQNPIGGVTLLEDVARWEANRVYSERL